jgi:hypothetical protein
MTLRGTLAAAGALGTLIAASYAVISGTWSNPSTPLPAANAVVVAELFTSEGCSSCPPADTLLTTLVQRPVDGVTVLGLSEHVDYWNRLGWRDPFSSAAFTSRQTEYQARVFRGSSIYTPQLVIDGHLEEVGSDARAVERAIAKAAQAPKAAVDVTAAPAGSAANVRIQIDVNVPPIVTLHESADVILAVTEDRLVSNVQRGENRGRHLTHSAVVRVMTRVDMLSPDTRRWSTTTSAAVRPEWKSEDLKVIAFVQEQSTRRIVGAGFSYLAARSEAP